MEELEKIYRLWWREMKRFVRERSRLLTSVVTPLLWILVFGGGMRNSAYGGAAAGHAGDYRQFIYPGILGMTLLFSSMFTGVSVVWEREFGFLKEVLVAPISRAGLVIGKALGGSTCALIQGLLLLLFTPLIRMHFSLSALLFVVPVMFLISFGVTCIGLTIAVFMESLEGFNMIMSFAIMPMLFCSGALYPLRTAPPWLRTVSFFDPLTYGVDALRGILLGRAAAFMPLALNIAILAAFALVMTGAASICYSLNRK